MTLQPSLAVLACLLCGCQVSAQVSAGSPEEANPAPPPGAQVVTSPASAEPPSVPSNSASTPTATQNPTATPTPTAQPSTDASTPGVQTSTSPSATAAPEPPPLATTPKVRTSGDRILLPGNVVFQSGQSILSPTPENETVLQQLKGFLDDNPKVSHVRIEGYTDNVGQPEANLRLSGERALAIKTWLVARGIPTERLVAVGFGADKPIADNATPEGRAQNRRTEFKIAAVNGNPYRGVPLNGGGTEFK